MADEKPEKEEAPAGPKMILGLPLPQFAFLAVNILVMLAGLGFIVWASLLYKKPPITDEQVVKEITKKAAKPVEENNGVFVENYPEMTITLKSQQGGKTHYAVVEVSLVCGSEKCLSQVKANRAKIEDAIQTSLSSRSYGELGSLEVKFRVKHEIAGRVNGFLKDAAVVDVLFTNFLVM